MRRVRRKVIVCVTAASMVVSPAPVRADAFWNCAKDYTEYLANLVPEALEKLADAKEVLEAAQAVLQELRLSSLAAGAAATGTTAAAIGKAAAAVAAAETAVAAAITGVEVATVIAVGVAGGTAIGQGADYLISRVWDPILPVAVDDPLYYYPTDAEVDSWIPELLLAALGRPWSRSDFDRADAIQPGSGTASWDFLRSGARCFAIAARGAGMYTAGKCDEVLRAGADLQVAIAEYATAINGFAALTGVPTFGGDPATALQNAALELDGIELALDANPQECVAPCDSAVLRAIVAQGRATIGQAINALVSIGDGAGNAVPLDGGYFPVSTRDRFLAWLDSCQLQGVGCLPPIEIAITDRFVQLLGVAYDGAPSIAPQIAEWDGMGDTGNEAELFGPDGIMYLWEVLVTSISNHWSRVDLSASPLIINCAPNERTFRRGDSNADGTADISDAAKILGFLFLGSSMNDCLDAADVNDDGAVDISDPVRLLGYLFLGSERPPEPFLSCGADSIVDGLDCKTFAPCP